MFKNIKKVYGPYDSYRRNKKRRVVIVIFENGNRITMSNARWLMVNHLKRWLKKEETVDHIDGNPLNDNMSNLQIMSLEDNVKKSKRLEEMFSFVCPVCNKNATKLMRHVKHNRKQGKAGPFCGKHCAREWQSRKNLL